MQFEHEIAVQMGFVWKGPFCREDFCEIGVELAGIILKIVKTFIDNDFKRKWGVIRYARFHKVCNDAFDGKQPIRPIILFERFAAVMDDP